MFSKENVLLEKVENSFMVDGCTLELTNLYVCLFYSVWCLTLCNFSAVKQTEKINLDSRIMKTAWRVM